MNRRLVLKTGVGLASLAVVRGRDLTAAESVSVVDTNVSLFRWPFRRLPLDDPEALAARLATVGITEAWAGSFEGLLHRDLTAVNARLDDVCRRYPLFRAVGSIDPTLPGWVDDLRRCAEVHGMHAIRLLPGYHGYSLSDERFRQVLLQARKRGLLVQIAVAMEDVRTQHPSLRADDVDLEPLARLVKSVEGARVQLLNWRPRAALLPELQRVSGISFDTARVEGTDGVPRLVRALPRGRVWFGSHAPFLIPEAALIRTHESGQLNDDELRGLLGAHAIQGSRG